MLMFIFGYIQGLKQVILILTKFKTSINDPYKRAGNVKASLNLCDGALHVAPLKGFGKEHTGHGKQKHLRDTHKHIL